MSLLGADLPSDLSSGLPDNEPGFWEPREIVLANERLLVAARSAWDDVSPIPESWFAGEQARRYEDELVELLSSSYGSSKLFVLKDPRICLLMPLWLAVLERFHAEPLFVLPIRNPLDVAASLRRRNGFILGKSQLLWLRHVLDAERFTRGHPRVFISYDALLDDWMPVVDKVAADLGLTWSRVGHETRVEIDRFLSAEYRHHHASSDELEKNPNASPMLKRTHRVIAQVADGPDSSIPDGARVMFDGAYRGLNDADRVYGPLLAEARIVAREEAEGRTAELRNLQDSFARSQDATAEHMAILARNAIQLHGELSEVTRELEDTSVRLVTGAGRARELEVALAASEARVNEKDLADQQRERELAGQAELQAREALQFQGELSEVTRELADTQRRAREHAARISSLEADLERAAQAQEHELAGQAELHAREALQLQGELSEVTRELADTQRHAREHAARIYSLEAELELAAEAQEVLTRALADREQALGASDERAVELATELARLQGELSAVEAERADTAGALEQSWARASDVEATLRARVALKEQALESANAEVGTLAAHVAGLQTELATLDAELGEAVRELEQGRARASDLEDRLHTALTTHEVALRIRDERLRSLTDRLALLDQALSRRDKDLRTRERDVRGLRAQLEARPSQRAERGLRRLGLGIAAPFVAGAAISRRTSALIGWMVRSDTRPLAATYLGLRHSEAFDRDFYLAHYRDVARAGADPLLHYIQYGVRDGYDPSASFSTVAYLADHPELVASGENPLLHALQAIPAKSIAALPAGAGADQSDGTGSVELSVEEPVPGAIEAPEPPDDPEHPEPPAAARGPLESRQPVETGPDSSVPGASPSANGRTLAADPLEQIPRAATVLLASRGETSAPGALRDNRIWALPLDGLRSAEGDDSGSPSAQVIAEIEALRAKGASHLVFSADALGALDEMPDLRNHLDAKFRSVVGSETLVVYELSARRSRRRKTRSHRVSSATGLDIVCLPIIDWNYRFQRPQQLLTQFAARDHRVFYVATTLQRDSRYPIIDELAANVWSVRLPGSPDVNIYRELPHDELVAGLIEGLAALSQEARIDHAAMIVDLPFWARVAIGAAHRWGWKVIYDCMDEHGGFVVPDEDGAAETIRQIDVQEASLFDASDLVLATSKMLFEKIRPKASNTLLVPNAADFEHFASAQSRPLPSDMPRPIIGYYGAISSWFDSEMVAYAARARPDWSFVLAGRTTGADLDPFEGLTNTHFLGELAYRSVPGLLHQFDVACIPFHLIDLTLATNPVKFYEYMSAGKPVVSVALPELEPYQGYYYPAHTPSEFVAQVERALAEDGPRLQRERVALGRANTWTVRYHTIQSEIRSWYGKATIIIPSFNNPDCLRLCLDSIRDKTTYPNYEVIVVDNGSDEQFVDELVARSEYDPNLRVIPQGENLGFARANNIGIEAAADADYVILLNDDTVVTPGWLGSLLSHLRDDGIGMVGPVTSWAGNEARIPVPYGDDLKGLDEFAARRARELRGEAFDISVLAMYCVAMRKDVMDRLGRLEERFGIGMFEDDDFAMRVRRARLRVICAHDVFVHHWGRTSFKRMEDDKYHELFEENKRIFEEIWSQPWVPHQARR